MIKSVNNEPSAPQNIVPDQQTPPTPLPQTPSTVPLQTQPTVFSTASPSQPAGPQNSPAVPTPPIAQQMPQNQVTQPQVFAPTVTPTPISQQPVQTPAWNAPAQQPGATPFVAGNTISSSDQKPSKFKLLAIVGGSIIVLALIAIPVLLHFNSHITAADVNAALKATSNTAADIDASANAISDVDYSTDATDVKNKVATARTKLSQAQKDYVLIKKSTTLKDPDVKKSFTAVDKKWAPFTSYIQATADDEETLAPVVISFSSQSGSINDSADLSTTEGLSTYLSSFKNLVDTTMTKINGLPTMKLDTDKKSVEALKTFLQSASASLGSAQSDLASGNDSAIYSDLSAMEDASSTFSSATDAQSKANETKQQQLDPTNQINQLILSLDKLQTKIDK